MKRVIDKPFLNRTATQLTVAGIGIYGLQTQQTIDVVERFMRNSYTLLAARTKLHSKSTGLDILLPVLDPVPFTMKQIYGEQTHH